MLSIKGYMTLIEGTVVVVVIVVLEVVRIIVQLDLSFKSKSTVWNKV